MTNKSFGHWAAFGCIKGPARAGKSEIPDAQWGKLAEARALYDELCARAVREYVSPTVLAWAAASVGETDRTLSLIEQAYSERDPFLAIATRMPTFRPLLAVPGVREVIRRLDFPDGWPPAEADTQ